MEQKQVAKVASALKAYSKRMFWGNPVEHALSLAAAPTGAALVAVGMTMFASTPVGWALIGIGGLAAGGALVANRIVAATRKEEAANLFTHNLIDAGVAPNSIPGLLKRKRNGNPYDVKIASPARARSLINKKFGLKLKR